MADLHSLARALCARLNDPREGLVTLASEAEAVFAKVGDQTLDSWLKLELHGYGKLTEVRPLHEVLGVGPGDRLAVQVAAYRTQVGHVFEAGTRRHGSPCAHFFVESLQILTESAERVRGRGSTGALELEFGPHAGRPDYPKHLEFPVDVFDRVLLGFRATLHLRLRELAR